MLLNSFEINDFYTFLLQIVIVLFITRLIFLGIYKLSNNKGYRKNGEDKSDSKYKNPRAINYNDLYNAIPIPICRINELGHVEMYNQSFQSLIGIDPKSHKNLFINEIFDDKLQVSLRQLYVNKYVNENVFSEIFTKGNQEYKVSARFIIGDDELTEHLILSFEPLIKCPEEETISYIKSVLRQLVRESEVAIIVADDEGLIIHDNLSMIRMYGAMSNGLIGKKLTDIFPVEFQAELNGSFKDVLTNKKRAFRGILVDISRKLIPVSVRCVQLKVINSIRTMFVIEDISALVESENRLAEAQKRIEQSDRLKASFLANISHEIRTPLNAILGFSELINDPRMREVDRMGFIQQIKQSGESLLELIGGIINFSRITSGELSVVRRKIDMQELFIHLQRYAVKSNKLKSRPLKIRSEIVDRDKDYNFHSDFEKIFQILKNIIDNAIKFTFSGSVEFGCLERGKNYLQFYVKDTGIGIPVENQKFVFERFVQGDISNAREFGGTGIGLTISAELVRLLGGYLWIDSKVGVGSCFNVVMPKEYTSQPHLSIYSVLGTSVSKKSILIIDEKELNYTNMLNTISNELQQGFWAKDMSEAINILYSNSIDMIFINGDLHPTPESINDLKLVMHNEIVILSYNIEIFGLMKSQHLYDYPFTEKELAGIFKNYFCVDEFSMSSNSMSIR